MSQPLILDQSVELPGTSSLKTRQVTLTKRYTTAQKQFATHSPWEYNSNAELCTKLPCSFEGDLAGKSNATLDQYSSQRCIGIREVKRHPGRAMTVLFLPYHRPRRHRSRRYIEFHYRVPLSTRVSERRYPNRKDSLVGQNRLRTIPE